MGSMTGAARTDAGRMAYAQVDLAYADKAAVHDAIHRVQVIGASTTDPQALGEVQDAAGILHRLAGAIDYIRGGLSA